MPVGSCSSGQARPQELRFRNEMPWYEVAAARPSDLSVHAG